MTTGTLVEALGWTLLHSLWQLALVGAIAGLLLAGAGPGRPRMQYALALLAMLACLILPALTLGHALAQAPSLPLPAPVEAAALPQLAPAGPIPEWPQRLQTTLTLRLPWIVAVWSLGVLGMGLRLGAGWFTVARWRRQAIPVPAAWEARFRVLNQRLRTRGPVLLRASLQVTTPLVLGLWHPVVLVPAALLTQLSESYLEALLAHELAHVQRWDPWFNLFQNVVEVLCFHHPVVWWLSRKVRILREQLCDDLAAQAIGDRRRLALALNALDDLRPPATHLALAAKGGSLYHRIHHLITPTPSPRRPWGPGALLGLILALPLAALTLHAASSELPTLPVDAELVAQIDALAAKEGIDPNLLRSLAWAESHFRRGAKSSLGAKGILQVMPATALKYGASNLDDPDQVAAAGARYLRFLLDHYQGDVTKAVAAYNCGEQSLDAGRITLEASNERALVLSLLQGKTVQAERPLDPGEVTGTLVAGRDGKTWTLHAGLNTRNGFTLEVLPSDPTAKPFARLVVGNTLPAATAAWSISRPTVLLPLPAGTPFTVRCSSDGGALTGSIQAIATGPWQTFRFRMTAASNGLGR